jgi:hypothetical protein
MAAYRGGVVHQGKILVVSTQCDAHTQAQNGTGSRLIPDGAITGAHWLITPDYIQVTGEFLNRWISVSY